MKRRPNRTPRGEGGTRVTFTAEEIATLKWNIKPPNSELGGMARLENWILDNTDHTTRSCVFDATHQRRTINYCQNYGPGGPNGRIRRACKPAFARIGIIIGDHTG